MLFSYFFGDKKFISRRGWDILPWRIDLQSQQWHLSQPQFWTMLRTQEKKKKNPLHLSTPSSPMPLVHADQLQTVPHFALYNFAVHKGKTSYTNYPIDRFSSFFISLIDKFYQSLICPCQGFHCSNTSISSTFIPKPLAALWCRGGYWCREARGRVARLHAQCC